MKNNWNTLRSFVGKILVSLVMLCTLVIVFQMPALAANYMFKCPYCNYQTDYRVFDNDKVAGSARYVYNGASNHLVYYKYNIQCENADCRQVFQAEPLDGFGTNYETENHNPFPLPVGETCSICHFTNNETPPPHTHNFTQPVYQRDGGYEQYNEEYHNKIEYYRKKCDGCDQYSDEYPVRTQEAHDYSNGVCSYGE